MWEGVKKIPKLWGCHAWKIPYANSGKGPLGEMARLGTLYLPPSFPPSLPPSLAGWLVWKERQNDLPTDGLVVMVAPPPLSVWPPGRPLLSIGVIGKSRGCPLSFMSLANNVGCRILS